MSLSESQASSVLAPRKNQVVVQATSTTTAYIDLNTTITPAAPSGSLAQKSFYRGRYVTIQAESADVYIALVNTTSDTLDPTATGTPATGGCILIPANQEKSFLLETDSGAWRYLAYRTATGTGKIRVWASSPK